MTTRQEARAKARRSLLTEADRVYGVEVDGPVSHRLDVVLSASTSVINAVAWMLAQTEARVGSKAETA